MLKPAIVVGAETVNSPQPALTFGAGGAAGKMITFTWLLILHSPAPLAPDAEGRQEEASAYCAEIAWHPGVVGIAGVAVYAPPSILYWVVNPVTATTVGSVNPALQVLVGAINKGAEGKTTAFTVVAAQLALVVFARVPPQSVVSLYLALIVQQPGILVNIVFAAPKSP